ncbi:MAG: glycosyltransferase [Mycobacterium sp.]
MATVLAYTSPALGNLFPIAALLCELHRRGHRIVLATFAEGVAIGRASGFESVAIDPRIEALTMTDWMASNARDALKAAFGVFGKRAAHEVADLQGLMNTAGPDALVIDANCWGAATAAEVVGVPWLAFWPFTPFMRSRDTPPYGPGLRPWPGVAGRLRDALLRPMITGGFESAMLKPLNAIREASGAVPAGSADDFVRRAPLILVATGEPFEYRHSDWGDSVKLIGPCDLESATTAPDWLADIDRPLVLVTTSSDRQADSELPVVAMSALADEPVHVVVTYPAGVPTGVEAASNATMCRFVPHGPILDRAVCAITHGGMGATQKALARGVPVCAVPYGRDQFEVARRVEVSRCGTRLPAKRLSVQRLRKAATAAMSMTRGAERVAAGFRATGGVKYGADLVEQRLLGL